MSEQPTPALTQLIVIRHGETAWNRERRIQGQLDVPLNAHGEAQATALGAALETEPLEAIYSSDLSRALMTARAIASRRALAVRPEPLLRERHFGAFQGLTHEEIAGRYPEDFAAWQAREADHAPRGGERLSEFYARVVDISLTLARRHPGGRIALVAHGGVLDCMYRAARGLSLAAPRQHDLRNAGINRLHSDGLRLTVVRWGDVAHLDVRVLDDSDHRRGS